ncbi:MAG: amidohydrolase [Oscillospiraceae bacterium]|jgi:amidohydrolase|nr:amidohydrolase [Oscillospiraceae bacterium]
MDIMKESGRCEALAVEHRRHLHRHPELSGLEYKTLKYIDERLTEYGVDHYEVENGGILGFIGTGPEDNTLLLRADIDALPIRENPRNLKREREVISETDGVQHACGHDAHTAILLAAAKILKERETDLSKGRVLLLFERGEEGNGNLRYLIRHIREHDIKVSAAHGLHVRADLPVGKMIARSGPVMAGAAGFQVTLRGRGGHGSRPDLANSPVDCFNALYSALSSIRLRCVSPFDGLTFSIGYLKGGDKGNIIPSELAFGGSARFYKKEIGVRFAEEFRSILDGVTAAYRCSYDIAGLKPGIPTVNNDDAIAFAREGIVSHLGADVLAEGEPLMGSESFSILAAQYPSAFLFLGVKNDEYGSGADLHSEYFDLDEAALKIGIAETVAFALEYVKRAPRFRQQTPYQAELLQWLER